MPRRFFHLAENPLDLPPTGRCIKKTETEKKVEILKIKQVEDRVGISRKNIRFYEEQGLLSPRRAENGYREYNESDILRLKQIKFLRKLNVPIQQIQMLTKGTISPSDCFRRHLTDLHQSASDLQETMLLTQRAMEQNAPSLDALDIDACLAIMEQKEQEGTRFMDFDKTDVHRKKSLGAILGGSIMILLMGMIIWMVLWANSQDPLPTVLLLIVLVVPAAVVVGVIAVLIQRLREIRGGEEDDAAQY